MKEKQDVEITTAEAAEVLGMNQSSVRRLYSDGVIAGRKPGHDLLLSRNSVLDYQKNRRPRGRPFDSLSTEPAPTGSRRDYHRDFQREKRAGDKGAGKKSRTAGPVTKKTARRSSK